MGVKNVKKINLALQGGGSHGAFTWGVLTRLLEDERIDIEAISGTSAGAVNGAITAYGHAVGGNSRAAELLQIFWKRISKLGDRFPFKPTPIDRLINPRSIDYNPWYQWVVGFKKLFSPYHFNPFNFNPVMDIINELIDFEVLQKNQSIKLFVNATNVMNCSLRIFHGEEITAETLAASSCLPTSFQAVEIDGAYYWDGGYMGNPAFTFLPHLTNCKDILFILLDPIHLDQVPKTPTEIHDRIHNLSFNTSLLKDIRAVLRLKEFASWHGVDMPLDYFFHIIEAQDYAIEYGMSSKYNTEWDFMQELYELGYKDTGLWIDQNIEHVGKRSSVDLEKFGFTPQWTHLDDVCGVPKNKS